MTDHKHIRVFLTGPDIDPAATGESFNGFKWARALSDVVDLTVFTFQRHIRPPLQDSLPNARVITAPRPRFFARWPRFDAMAKPHYPLYIRAVRDVLRKHAGEFDVGHQILPAAPRFPIALQGTGLPYLVGPVGGLIETPASFKTESARAPWFTRARALDQLRLRYDPWLRRGYAEADIMLGTAPYMKERLSAVPLKRFEALLHISVPDLAPEVERPPRTKDVRLLHVGRGVRSKGLRDLIRAMAQLSDTLPDMTLTVAGAGEEIEFCKREAAGLGLANRVTFLGMLKRDEVEKLYPEADIFAFPSFQEPAGNVVYEAMRWGLPVITANAGGPGFMVDDATGIRIAVTEPKQYASDIASAIETLAMDPAKRREMGEAARRKLEREAFMPAKARRMADLYADVLEKRRSA